MKVVNQRTKFCILMWKNYKTFRCKWKIFVFEFVTKFLLIYTCRYIFIQGAYLQPVFPLNPGETDPLSNLVILYAPTNAETDKLLNKAKTYSFLASATVEGLNTPEEVLKKWQEKTNNNSADTQTVGVIINEISPTSLSYDIRVADKINTGKIYIQTFPGPSPRHLYRRFTAKFLNVQRAVESAYVSDITGKEVEIPFPEVVAKRTECATSHKALILARFVAWSGLIICTFYFKNVMDGKESGGIYYQECLGLGMSLQWFAKIVDVFVKSLLGQALVAIALSLSIRVNWAVLWIFLVLYTTDAAICLSFISVFFRTTPTALVVGFLVWISTSILGKAALLFPEQLLTHTVSWVISFIFPNMNLSLGFLSLCNIERISILKRENREDQHQFGLLILLILASSAFYLTLTLWLTNIWHPERGVNWKPWRFRTPKESLSPRTSALAIADYYLENEKGEKVPIEEPPVHYYPEVRVRNVTRYKRSSDKKSLILDDLSMDFFGNEVTCIIGKTGIGKSTLIGVMMGRLVPHDGTVFYGQMEVTDDIDLELIRGQIGWCPQESRFLECLTVREHLIFAGKLRDVSSKRLEQEIPYLLAALALEDVADKAPQPGKWSESLCRRTSVAFAVLGRPQIIYLDDPTCGVDVDGRRRIWNVLQGLRSNRVIIVATNHMEEVDEFADRVILLNQGKVHFWGSPRFLRNHYDVGLEVEVERSAEVPHGTLERTIRRYESNVRQRSFRPGLVNFRLPSSAIPKCPALLRELRNLGVEHLNLRMCGMKEVFLKATKFDYKDIPSRITQITKHNVDVLAERKFQESPSAGTCKQFIALLQKEITLMKCMYAVYLFGAIFLIMMMCGIFAISEVPLFQNYGSDVFRRMKLSLKIYGGMVVYQLAPNGDDINVAYRGLVLRDGGKPKPVENAADYFQQAEQNDTLYFNVMTMIGARLTWDTSQPKLVPGTPLYSQGGIHSAAVSLNLLSNAVLRALNFRKVVITVYNDPFPKMVPTLIVDTMGRALLSEVLQLVMVLWFFAFARTSIAEYLSCSYQTQLRTGASSLLVVGTRFLCHFTLHTVVGFVLVIGTILAGSRMYGCSSGIQVLCVIWLVNGFASLPFVYFLVRMGLQLGELVITLAAMVVANIVFYQYHVTFNSQMKPYDPYIYYLNYIYPPFALMNALLLLFYTAQGDSVCRLSRQYLCPLAFGKDATYIKRRECMIERHYITLVQEYLWKLMLIGVVCFIIVVLIDCEFCNRILKATIDRIKSIGKKEPKTDFKGDDQIDRSIITERHLAIQAYEQMPSLRRDFSPVLPPAHAVAAMELLRLDKKGNCVLGDAAGNPLSFRVRAGECFGLLGPDPMGPRAAASVARKGAEEASSEVKLGAGAGSKPLIHLLAGYLRHWQGDVAGVLARLREDRRRYMWNVRYTPQNCGFVSLLTVEEHLQLYCGLRGVKYMDYLTKWGGIFGLWPVLSVQMGQMTPGQRRIMAVALAFIAGPALALMEFPTKGLDPRTCRRIAVAFASFQQYQRSIVLTSNRLLEVIDLCHRVAVMYAGRFICLGSTLYLGDRGRKGFIVTFEVVHRHRVGPLLKAMDQQFGSRSILEDIGKVQRKVRFCIVGGSLKIEDLIEDLEIVRAAVPDAVDYTICEICKIPILSERLIGVPGPAERA